MMFRALLWIYLLNAVLLIDHEIDSAYWEEWKLFKLPGGISLFVVLHLPLLAVVLYGLVLIERMALGGLIISLVLTLSGLFAFTIHRIFIRQGHDEFTIPTSQFLLWATLIMSITQLGVTVYLLV
jgi:hypothetical protein